MIHAPELLDRLGALPTEKYSGKAFRVTPQHIDPLATNGGRWAPADECTVLYTSLSEQGALAEMSYHLKQWDPLPTKPVKLNQLNVKTNNTLRLLRANLQELGVDMSRYGNINYRKTQRIGAAVAFLEYDGLIVPSARWDTENLVFVANSRLKLESVTVVSTAEVDWQKWARKNGIL